MNRAVRHSLFTKPSEAEVLRLLGYRQGTTQLTPQMIQILREVMETGAQMLQVNCVTKACTKVADFGAGGLFGKAEMLVLGIVTIGSAIEEQAERFVTNGEWTRGLALDAYGSAAVEAASVEIHYKICKYYEKDGLVAGRRISPGYPRWPIEQQRALFDEFTGETAGIELNEHFIMIPRKSISFGVPLGRNLEAESPELGCKYCSMTNCEFRRQPAAAEGEVV